MIDRMDTTIDNPSFDLQSIHVSYEERRWLNKQRHLYKLDNLVKSIGDLHKTIREFQQFSLIPTSLSTLSMVPKVSLDDQHSLYYSSGVCGNTDNQIDLFRLHNQQMFQLTFNDLSNDPNYCLFFIIMEGLIFSSSQTVKEYSTLLTYEMRKCLTSFDSFIQTRSSKIIDLISFLPKFSLPSYTLVHTQQQNNIGILFQLLPKIKYHLTPTTEYNSILAMDEYAKYTISLEELRYMDYSTSMKNKRHIDSLQSATFNTAPTSVFTFGRPPLRNSGTLAFSAQPPQILHSLPIEYPYDDTMVYSQPHPSFWTGNNHTNENSNALFECIPIEANTPEYVFVQRSFYKTVSEGQIKIAFIERIQNPHLWEKFRSHRSYMRRKNGNENLNENWLFHGTKSDNHHHIMSHGFNRSYCRDSVYYGRGVYFSRYASYSFHYSDRQDLSFLFLCRVLVGHSTFGSNDIRIPPQINSTNGKQIQADSTTDHQNPYTIVCTFHDDQNYPEYIITYMNKSSEH